MRYKIAAIYVLLQVLFFAAWAGYEESLFWSGESVLVKVVPVDPRDMLSGQYLDLGYEFSTLRDLGIGSKLDEDDWPVMGSEPERWGDDVWVVLAKKGELHVPVRAAFERPCKLAEGEVTLKGSYGFSSRAYFGIERYFVPEGTPTPKAADLTVRLRITSGGKARIEQVYLKGEPWP